MDAFSITVTHSPEGEGSLDNEQWTRTFTGRTLSEVMVPLGMWALTEERRRRTKLNPQKQGEEV